MSHNRITPDSLRFFLTTERARFNGRFIAGSATEFVGSGKFDELATLCLGVSSLDTKRTSIVVTRHNIHGGGLLASIKHASDNGAKLEHLEFLAIEFSVEALERHAADGLRELTGGVNTQVLFLIGARASIHAVQDHLHAVMNSQVPDDLVYFGWTHGGNSSSSGSTRVDKTAIVRVTRGATMEELTNEVRTMTKLRWGLVEPSVPVEGFLQYHERIVGFTVHQHNTHSFIPQGIQMNALAERGKTAELQLFVEAVPGNASLKQDRASFTLAGGKGMVHFAIGNDVQNTINEMDLSNSLAQALAELVSFDLVHVFLTTSTLQGAGAKNIDRRVGILHEFLGSWGLTNRTSYLCFDKKDEAVSDLKKG